MIRLDYAYFWLLVVVDVVVGVGHLKRKKRKLVLGTAIVFFWLRQLVGGRQGLMMMRSKGQDFVLFCFFVIQTVASLTANLDRMVAAADKSKGQDSSLWLYFRVVGVGRGDGVATV